MLNLSKYIKKEMAEAEEKQKRKPLICYRIENLYTKLDTMYKYLSQYGANSVNGHEFSFQSKLGKRHIKITCLPFSISFDYANDYESIFTIIFHFSYHKKFERLEMLPYTMTLTYKDIDLAILEFENYIEPIYQQALEQKRKHNSLVKYFGKVEDNEREVNNG